ncbi:hypothetical protein M0R04_09465 [Candidatus Dojkabacteria bacterium]|jgi:hypothetical protein|nr:hypothetical protein [Candidatus Dojkabacteria bacterium]
MKYEISQELAQGVLNYLAEKPYKETFVLIAELQKLKVITELEDGKDVI